MRTVFRTVIQVPEDVVQDFIDTVGQTIEALETLMLCEHKLRVFNGLADTLKGFAGNGSDAELVQKFRDTLKLPVGRHMREIDIRSALANLKRDFDSAVELLDIQFPLLVSYTSDVIGQQPIDGQELHQVNGKQVPAAERGTGNDIPF